MSDTFTSQSTLRTSSARRFESVLDDYGDANGSHPETLVDLLADAMHWCDTTGGDFHIALAQAGNGSRKGSQRGSRKGVLAVEKGATWKLV